MGLCRFVSLLFYYYRTLLIAFVVRSLDLLLLCVAYSTYGTVRTGT
jgi:hypothetical protein